MPPVSPTNLGYTKELLPVFPSTTTLGLAKESPPIRGEVEATKGKSVATEGEYYPGQSETQ